MDQVKQDAQFDLEGDTVYLSRIPILLFSLALFYYCYKWKKQNDFEHEVSRSNIEKLKGYEFEVHGPVLLKPQTFKFEQKYQTREQFHKWLENDVRSFH